MNDLTRIDPLVVLARFSGALMDEVAGAAERVSMTLQYPMLFQAFVERHTFVAFVVGDVRVYGNVRGEEDSLDDLMADKIITSELVNAGFLPFGRPSNGCYDRICFDIRGSHEPEDAPVVRMDHEAILSDNRIPEPERLAKSLMALVDCALLRAQSL